MPILIWTFPSSLTTIALNYSSRRLFGRSAWKLVIGEEEFIFSESNFTPNLYEVNVPDSVAASIEDVKDGLFEVTDEQTAYTLTIEASPTEGGDVSFDGSTWSESTSTTVNEGTEVEIESRTANGYTFEGWYENGNQISTNNPYTVTVDSNREIEARFITNPENINLFSGNWHLEMDDQDTVSAKAGSLRIYVSNNKLTSISGGYFETADIDYLWGMGMTLYREGTEFANSWYDLNGYTLITHHEKYEGDWILDATLTYNNGTITGEYTINTSGTIRRYTVVLTKPAEASLSDIEKIWDVSGQCEIRSDGFSKENFTAYITIPANCVVGTKVLFKKSMNGAVLEEELEIEYIHINSPRHFGFSGTMKDGDDFTLGIVLNTDNTVNGYVMEKYSGGYNLYIFSGNEIQNVLLTIEASPTEGGDVSFDGSTWSESTSTTVNEGTEVEIESRTANGYTFEGWYENDTQISVANPHSVTVNEDKTIQARFNQTQPDTYTLTIEASPTDGGTVSGDGDYEAGTKVDITATANSGYQFVNWTKDGVEISTQANDTYTMPSENVTLVANFEEAITFDCPVLEQAVRDADGYTGEPTGSIFPEDVLGINLLNLVNNAASSKSSDTKNNAITSLTGIEYLKNLKILWLGNNQIEDISSLQNLTNLVELTFHSNSVSDISPLQNLTNLEALGFSGNQVSDISPLQNLTKLEILGIYNNQISNITVLQHLINLEWLAFSYNNVTDIQPLVNNSGLDDGDIILMEHNNLDLTPGSQNMTDINTLIGRGVDVEYEPQN